MNLLVFLSFLSVLVAALDHGLLNDDSPGPVAMAKRDWTCPQGYHYLTSDRQAYHYWFCCPEEDDKMLLPNASASPPVCCKKSDKVCKGKSVSISDWCPVGQEVTNYGGIVGCRADPRMKKERAIAEKQGDSISCPFNKYPLTSDDARDGYYYVFCCDIDRWNMKELQLPASHGTPPTCCLGEGDSRDCSDKPVSFLDASWYIEPGRETTNWGGVMGCRSKNRDQQVKAFSPAVAPHRSVPANKLDINPWDKYTYDPSWMSHSWPFPPWHKSTTLQTQTKSDSTAAATDSLPPTPSQSGTTTVTKTVTPSTTSPHSTETTDLVRSEWRWWESEGLPVIEERRDDGDGQGRSVNDWEPKECQ